MDASRKASDGVKRAGLGLGFEELVELTVAAVPLDADTRGHTPTASPMRG